MIIIGEKVLIVILMSNLEGVERLDEMELREEKLYLIL
jgi:hypothetical protein